jgi:hypothetical protein
MITLRDYQKDISNKACDILTAYGIVYLSMEVRTGKTLTALQTANKYGASSVLFVTKKKAISSIENDYSLLAPDYDIKVINYESLHKIDKSVYNLLICDESHSMGAFPKPSKRVKELAKTNIPIIYLSGTPTPESWSQLYHQFFISYNSPFKEKSFYRWADRFVNKKTRMINGNTINDYSNANIDLIKKETDHLFISYTQKQAGFNQTINEHTLFVDMPNNCKFLIDKLKKYLVIQGDEEVVLADTPVKLMQKVHQLSSGTIKFESGNSMSISTFKADYIKQYFKGQKIAIFYKFKAEFDCLKSVFTNWTNDIEDFNNNKEKVFLSQIVSGREGINLSVADSLIFYNIDFSATSYLQARDRLTSKTRTKENKVYWIFSDYGIEKDIYKAVSNKMDYTLKHFRK